MSAAAAIAVAIGAVVVLVAVAFVTLARSSDVRGAGTLSSESRRRDRAARPTTALSAGPTAATVEAQA